jgi:hypothetical protein
MASTKNSTPAGRLTMVFQYAHLVWRLSPRIMVAILLASAPAMGLCQEVAQAGKSWQYELRYRTETKAGSGRFHTLTRREDRDAARTAVIVCDVWDAHHSINAVRRVEEMAPRIDQFVKRLRTSGATN